MLNLEQRQDRIVSARKHTTTWDGSTTEIEVSISNTTAKDFGYEESDDGQLYRKVKDGITQNGWFLINCNCPQAETVDELTDLCVLLGTDILKLGNAKIKTEFQNAVRGFLNRKQDSKKAIEHARKQQASEDIKDQLASGELTMEQAFVEMQKLI